MMSLQQIRSYSDSAARKSRRAGILPKILNAGDDVRGIPMIGNRTPRGWKCVAQYFVDASGFGQKGEPALTTDEFRAVVAENPGFGWAITEAGQFQVYVGQFEKRG